MKNNYFYTKLEHSNPDHADWFVVNWCLGNTCNFSCSYCPDSLHNASIPWPSVEIVKSFINRVMEQKYPKKVYFEFTGGEVTLNKNFIDICEECTSLGARVGLISNGSRTIRWWEENKKYFDHVCLSFHPDFSDADHFIKVVKLINNDIRTHVNIMMKPEKFDFCYSIANKIKELGNISMALQPLLHDFSDKVFDYNDYQKRILDKQHELITKHIKFTKSFDYYRGAMKMTFPDGQEQISSAHRFIHTKNNDWSGWKCYSGVEQVIVDMDGRIYRGWCKVGDSVGSIFDENLVLPTEPILCTKNMCHCNFDIMSTKEVS